MTEKKSATVLIVDDRPDREGYVVDDLTRKGVEASITHPEEVSVEDLLNADLVLVDFVLTNWDERESASSPARQPMDGLALVAVLRAWTKESSRSSPTAFALRSAHLHDLSEPLLPESREHVIARLHNLEWAFEKGRKDGLIEGIESLALGVADLPPEWPLGDANAVRLQTDELLALDRESDWYERAWESVQRCHPPLAELSNWSHGLAFVRWLAHRVLPYPTFLFDDINLAARLRVTVESLEETLRTSQAEELLEGVRYTGICNRLIGDRWWRAGLEALLWQLTDGAPFDRERIHGALAAQRLAFEPLDTVDPVVCLGEDLLPLRTLGTADAAVRLFPDDWPPFADLPWAPIDLVRDNETLRTVVLEADIDRLTGGEDAGP